MPMYTSRLRFSNFAAAIATLAEILFFGTVVLALSLAAWARQNSTPQQPSTAPAAQTQQTVPAAAAPENPPAQTQTPAPPDGQPSTQPSQSTPAAPAETAPAQPSTAGAGGTSQASQPGEITEDQLRKILVGKNLFLRGGYLDNSLSFNEHGAIIGHSAQGSYTLSGIQIDRVRLTRHKVELDGQRYGLHFLGALPYEDPTKAVDRVNITPKKKEVHITIDRELVVKPKQEKGKGWFAKNAPAPAAKPAPAAPASTSATTAPNPAPEPSPAASNTASQPEPTSSPASAQTTAAPENPDSEAQAEIAAAPVAERPADPKSVTTTTSPAHANKVLTDALENIFAQGFDDRMMASMPGFWKLYYEAVAAKTDYRPKDPLVLRQNMVDQKARLISTFEPASNQFAQDKGVAGMSLYHVVIESDGRPGEISVARPIGFGLDESAVDSIRKASFAPAIKDGKPVPVLLDLVVEFRIYSKRTNVASAPENGDQKSGSALPGPYSSQHVQQQ
jgi:hypothetical protein